MSTRRDAATLTSGLSATAALVVIILATTHLLLTARVMTVQLHMNDFGKFYHSARQFLAGQTMYPLASVAPGPGGTQVYGFLNTNPPHFHLPLLALAWLRPGSALTVWALANAAALTWTLVLLVAELRPRLTLPRVLWLAAGGLALASTEALVITGQLALLLMLATTFAWIAARHGRWRTCGIWLGLVISVKPFALIVLPWLAARRQRDALAGAAAGALAAFAVGLVVFGWQAHVDWLRSLGAITWPWAAMNASLLGALSRGLGSSPFFVPWADAPGLMWTLWLGGGLAIGIATLVSAARADVDRALALLLLGALLISPLGWVYYWWLALPPAVALFSWRRPVWFWLALPCLFAPLGLVVSVSDVPVATVTLGSAYFWGTLGLWTAALAAGPPPAGATNPEGRN